MDIKKGVDALVDVVVACKDSEHGAESINQLGQSAVIITTAIKNCLLPIAAVNFGFEKARVYFSEKFERDFSEKMKDVSPENVMEPKASIAGPALQGLAFSHDEAPLKEMYLSLLASSSRRDMADKVHPSFVEIIRQLSSDEAMFFSSLVKFDGPLAIAQIRIKNKNGSGYRILKKHVMPIEESGQPVQNSSYVAMVDNFIRLGLVEVNYAVHLVADKAYDWVEKRPEYISALSTEDDGDVYFSKGIIEVISFGKKFAVSVGA